MTSSSAQTNLLGINSIFVALKNGVAAINNLNQIIDNVTTTNSSGVTTIHVVLVSS